MVEVSFWTNAKIDGLKAGVAAGLSLSQIGDALGCTRNAVAGKAGREGIKLQNKQGGVPGEPRIRRPKPEPGRPLPERLEKFRPLPVPLETCEETVDHTCTTVMELTENSCRWPTGHPDKMGFFFCGAPQFPERPYCGEHCLIAYQPMSGQTRLRARYAEVAA